MWDTEICVACHSEEELLRYIIPIDNVISYIIVNRMVCALL